MRNTVASMNAAIAAWWQALKAISWMRSFMVVIGLLCVICAMILGFRGQGQEMGWAAACAALFMFIAYIEEIAELRIGPDGLVARTRELEVKLQDLQDVLCAVARASVVGMVFSARVGGVPRRVEKSVVDRLTAALNSMLVTGARMREEVLSDLFKTYEFDFAMAILGGQRNPSDKVISEELDAIREGGWERPPTPDDVETFLQKHNLLNDARRDAIERFRRFVANREFPSVEWLENLRDLPPL